LTGRMQTASMLHDSKIEMDFGTWCANPGADCVNGWWVISASGLETARCPDCDLPSACRHGWYVRHLQDLPVQGTAVTLQVRLARWQCRNRRCQRRTFADRLPEIARSFARRTCRAAELGRLVGHAAGGRPAERLMTRLGLPQSDDTILQNLKRHAADRRAGATVRLSASTIGVGERGPAMARS